LNDEVRNVSPLYAKAADCIEALEAALRELASCDGSSDNVANAEVLARRVRAIARAALAPEQRK
jgi:hypothetical protein